MENQKSQLGPLMTRAVDIMAKFLVKPSRAYNQLWQNDIESIKSVLEPGDVVLVEGDQRVSQIIKYLTQSSWSHAALFIGDQLLTNPAPGMADVKERFGDDASFLLVESNIETGVSLTPLSKYRHYNIRICRPVGLKPSDVKQVVDAVVDQIGIAYDVGHIVGLMRYYFPFSFFPRRFQMTGARLDSSDSQTIICSSQIAMAFQGVRYPVQPQLVKRVQGRVTRPRLVDRIRRRPRRSPELTVYSPCNPMLITPRDFDLSPYFDIVKHSLRGANNFDYTRMRWSETEPPERSDIAASPGNDLARRRINEPPIDTAKDNAA